MYKFEICANSVESCIAAQNAGAQRVELCAAIPEGGTTPSYGEILTARKELNIKLHVIIRPRGGDFCYSPIEIRTMIEDIRMTKKLGVDGLVFGCLKPDGEIDVNTTRELMKQAEGLSVTFHRAFDCCKNPLKALEQIIDLGYDRILTSGQQATAEKGIPLLKTLVEKANNRIIILPAAGINKLNINKIAKETGAKEFHFSAREDFKSRMEYHNPLVSMGGGHAIDESLRSLTSESKVRMTIEALKSL